MTNAQSSQKFGVYAANMALTQKYPSKQTSLCAAKNAIKRKDSWLDKPLKRFDPDVLPGYIERQALLEEQERWGEANDLNAWMSGHWMTWRDALAGRWPPTRIEFLKRMREAKGRKRAA